MSNKYGKQIWKQFGKEYSRAETKKSYVLESIARLDAIDTPNSGTMKAKQVVDYAIAKVAKTAAP